ncbi:MAG: hypothetical protein WBF77_09380 [Sulfurimonadaceae bacterium]
MLIYDHNKEFIGIDQESLKLLGYQRFEDLIHEHKDVAELFVKKPGYIHNFTNFPWIDFVMHAEADDAKVIIAGKSKAFSATIDIVTLHLNKAPDEDAFLIKLKNIQNYQLDASERPEPAPTPFDLDTKEFNAPSETPQKIAEPTPVPTPEPTIEIEPLVEAAQEQAPLTFDEDIFIQHEESAPVVSTPAEEDLDIFFHEEEVQEEQRIETSPELPVKEESIFDNIKDEKSTPMLGAYLSEEDKTYLADLEVSDDYVYDPQIAADELGLPVDLIEEFIGDFIKQAHEFKDQLFTAIGNVDFDNIKVLSHKLKGVAANLRIEDSFEVLRNVNETSDIKECEANLKKFYITIAKLEGKDIEEVKRELEKPVIEELYDLTPKFQPVQEEEIIQPLDLPELEEKEASAEPVHLDTLYQVTEPATTTTDDSSDLYDFGLITEDGSEPLLVLDDEEEIISDLQRFDVAEEEEIISDIQDFEPEDDTTAENAPVLTYDINTAAAEIGLSADLVSALVDDYIVEANEMKNRLNEVISSSDVMRWKGYATQLKGVSDNLRIKEISEALQKLIASTEETQAKAAMQEFYGFINQL